MKSYQAFGDYYDNLTQNVDYKKLCSYYDGIIKEYGNGGKIVLDLACGTGKITFELNSLGYDMTGVDYSVEMLDIARNRSEKIGSLKNIWQLPTGFRNRIRGH